MIALPSRCPMRGLWVQVSLLGALLLSEVSGVEIFTPELVEAVNGSDVRLKCTFSSSHAVSPKAVTVSWNFRPLDQGTREESVFHYQEVAYPPTSGRFKERVVWSGDISRQDASITLQGVPPTFNGTYTCQVRNPPDVHGNNGEIVLKVVDKVSISEMALLAAIAGAACGVILLLVVVYVLVKRRRRTRWQAEGDEDVELPERRKEWKDPTVCSPAEAIHLTVVEKVLEVESSDDASEPSSGDDAEEEEEEEDDDDDDDDGGGGDDD